MRECMQAGPHVCFALQRLSAGPGKSSHCSNPVMSAGDYGLAQGRHSSLRDWLAHSHTVLSLQVPRGSQGGHSGPHSVTTVPPGPISPGYVPWDTGSGPLWALEHYVQSPRSRVQVSQTTNWLPIATVTKRNESGERKAGQKGGTGSGGKLYLLPPNLSPGRPTATTNTWCWDLLSMPTNLPCSQAPWCGPPWGMCQACTRAELPGSHGNWSEKDCILQEFLPIKWCWGIRVVSFENFQLLSGAEIRLWPGHGLCGGLRVKPTSPEDSWVPAQPYSWKKDKHPKSRWF